MAGPPAYCHVELTSGRFIPVAHEPEIVQRAIEDVIHTARQFVVLERQANTGEQHGNATVRVRVDHVVAIHDLHAESNPPHEMALRHERFR